MGINEDIRRMQAEGHPEQEIAMQMQNRGYGQQEIYDALAQSKIKEAVTGSPDNSHAEDAPMPQASNALQPSMLSQTASAEPPSPELETQVANPYAPYPSSPQYTQPYASPAPNQQSYGYQEQYYAGPSADAVAEVVDQIVAEKVTKLRQEMAKSIESKQLTETRLEYLDERLKKLERVIDRLQLSILQKVGEYMTNVEDLKTEVVETQKSFKSLLAEARPQQAKGE